MYNFRYHLITIVAIFAALALGLLLGAAIAGSDIVRNTSTDMVDALMTRFDETESVNQKLQSELADGNKLAQQLTQDWQSDRLTGRSIVILTTDGAQDKRQIESMRMAVAKAGATTVVVSFASELLKPDAGAVADLKEIVPEQSGEAYSATLARKLAEEWSYSYTLSSADSPTEVDATPLPLDSVTAVLGGVVPATDSVSDSTAQDQAATADGAMQTPDATLGNASQTTDATLGNASQTTDATTSSSAQTADSAFGSTPSAFQRTLFNRYSLTRQLIDAGLLSITVDYASLLVHTNPKLTSEQLAALTVMSAWGLPYGINGVIAAVASDGGTDLPISIARRFAMLGAQRHLPFPNVLRPSLSSSQTLGASGTIAQQSTSSLIFGDQTSEKVSEVDLSNASYFAVVIPMQTGASLPASVFGDQSLSGLLTLEDSVDESLSAYNLVALLSGGAKGFYGNPQDGVATSGRYVPIPADVSGKAAFAQ
ncbi:MAG: copper transporter [Coriobacteriales bacterium]|jgi:hypothetical protein|nr:copper transporter [Coriobacteriales bacterium]